MASLVVQGGAVVTGDGETMISNGALLLEGETVADVLTGPPRPDLIASADVVLDAAGGVIMPGFVNNHAHALTAGPRFASGAPSVGLEQALRNLDRHLLEGTTSLMNACGFCTADEVAQADRLHPINVRPATIHTPLNLRAAEIADGSGLAERHKRMTMAEMVERGAVGIGEVGAGHTLAGGGADYMYIPARVKAATGRDPARPGGHPQIRRPRPVRRSLPVRRRSRAADARADRPGRRTSPGGGPRTDRGGRAASLRHRAGGAA